MLGAAGTGKTDALVARAAARIRAGAASDTVLLLARSAAAAARLARRLEDALDGSYRGAVACTRPGSLCAGCSRAEALAATRSSRPPRRADRIAMLLDRVEELPLREHDFGRRPSALMASLVARIDRLKASSSPPPPTPTGPPPLRTPTPTPTRTRERERPAARERAATSARATSIAAAASSRCSTTPTSACSRSAAWSTPVTSCSPPTAAARATSRPGRARASATVTSSSTTTRTPRSPNGGSSACSPARAISWWPATTTPRSSASARSPPATSPTSSPSGPPRGSPARPQPPPAARARAGRPRRRRADRGTPRAHRGALATRLAGRESGTRGRGGEREGRHPLCGGRWIPGARRGGRRAPLLALRERAGAGAERRRRPRGAAASRARSRPERVAILVRSVGREGQPIGSALQERAIPHRVVGAGGVLRARARCATCSRGCGCSSTPPTPPAVVRALARPPIELRSVDLARVVQIARRRKLDMVSALAAATESPQLPPEARERIVAFLELHRSAAAALDTTRPDLFVHRLIDRLGLRRQQLFAAQADVVERLVNLARLGELAAAFVRRVAAGDPARVRALHRRGRRGRAAARRRRSSPARRAGRQRALDARGEGGREFDHVFVVGLQSSRMPGARRRAVEPIPDALLREQLPPDSRDAHVAEMRRLLHVAMTRAGAALVLAYARPRTAGRRSRPRRSSRRPGAPARRVGGPRGGAVRPGRDAALDAADDARGGARQRRADRRAPR